MSEKRRVLLIEELGYHARGRREGCYCLKDTTDTTFSKPNTGCSLYGFSQKRNTIEIKQDHFIETASTPVAL